VVVEEFRQNYLNQPYGDIWLLLKPLAYKTHPYQWNTIGKEVSHIEQASLQDVRNFYARFYNPNNAIVTVAGNITTPEVKLLAGKWFGPIPAGPANVRKLPQEAVQLEKRSLVVDRDVPYTKIYKAWHMCARPEEAYYTLDLISDLLGSGHSSRLYAELVRRQKLFSEITAYVSGDNDPGLFVVSGKLNPNVDPFMAEEAINRVVMELSTKKLHDTELRKVKNKVISTLAYENISLLNRAMNLTFSENLGDANLFNQLPGFYRKVNADKVFEQANEVFRETNSNTLIYRAKNQ